MRAPLRLGRAARPVPRAQAARAPGRDRAARLGPRSTRRCGSRSRSTTASRRRSPSATSRCARASSTARSTSSPCCARERRLARALLPRPAHAHALRRGLRDVAVRRGVAVGGDGDLLPAAARRARRGARAASRCRSRRCCATSSRRPGWASASSPSCATCAPRPTGATSRRPRIPRSRASSSAPPASTPRPPSASRRAAATSSARSRRTRRGPRRPPTRCCRCWPRPRALRLQLETGIAAHRRRFGDLARRPLAARVRLRAVARRGARGGRRARRLRRPHRRARLRRPGPAAPAAHRRGPAARPDRPGDHGPRLAHERLSLARRLPQHAPLHRAPPHAVGGRRRAL